MNPTSSMTFAMVSCHRGFLLRHPMNPKVDVIMAELGILVWQDFQFACGVYPAHDEFVEQVKAEAEANVTRLRHHASLALWCGNNEGELLLMYQLRQSNPQVSDYQQILQWNLGADLPAKKIYEQVLPEVVTRLAGPDVPYWRGSPYGGKGWDTTDPTVGDVVSRSFVKEVCDCLIRFIKHAWNIWAGMEHWQNYDILGGRFVR